MKTMKWLIRREFWEHKGSFFWAPLIVAAIMSIFIAATLGFGVSAEGIRGTYSINGSQGSFGALAEHVSDEQKAQLVGIMSNGYLFISAPIFLMLGFIGFFYCLSSLYDERRDRSILFWKSLPVSDSMTVLSKVSMAAAVAPLITIAVAIATSVLLLLMFCSALALKGVNVFGMVFSAPALYLAPLQMVALLPVYLLWALPTIGWLMMVSSWARSKVFLWAVGVPGLSVALLVWAENMFHFNLNIGWYLHNVIARGLLGMIPGAWIPMAGIEKEQLLSHGQRGIDMASIFTQSWATLASPGVWIGVGAGAAMIAVAIRMRRWREEG